MTINHGPPNKDHEPTRVRHSVLAVGCSFAFLTYIQRQAFVAATPEIKVALDLNQEQMGYLASAFLVAYGLFQVPCGLIGDRLGARHLLTILVLGWSVLTGVTALASRLPVGGAWPFCYLIGVRFLFGAFQAGAFPAWARVMTDWTLVGQRATAQGAVWMLSRLGGVVGPYLFLGLFLCFDTWTTPLWVLAGLGVVWCAAFWPWFRNRPEQMRQVNEAERELIAAGRGTAASERGIVPWSTLLTSVNVWALCLMYGFVGFAGNFITNLLPVYLADNRELPPKLVKGLMSLPLAFGIISCLLGGFLSDWIIGLWGSRKWGRRFSGFIGLTLAGLTILVVPWVQSVWLLAVVLSASVFFNDFNKRPARAPCADRGERTAGTISGAMNMIGQFGGALGMSFAGSMLEGGHSELLFIVFACSYALAACCWLAVDVTRPLIQR